jgi:hypothetical protein
VLQLVALLLKEDGVMLTPTIVAAHLAWTWTDDGRPSLPPWPYLIFAVLLGVGVIRWRQVALAGIGGYASPDWERARFNYWRGYSRTLAMLPVDRPWKWVAALFVVSTSVAGTVAALRARGRPLFVIAFGWLVVTLCNVPYMFVTKREQWHLLSLGGAILLTGATWAVWRALHARALRAAFAVYTAAAIIAMGSVARQMSADFAPYSPYVLETDRIVTEWAIVAPEIRTFLLEKRAAWDAKRQARRLPQALRTVSYGIHGGDAELRESGWRWTSAHVTLFVNPHARTIRIPLGAVALPSMAGGPERVSIAVNRRAWRDVALPVGEWTPLDVPLPSATSERRLHRIDLWFARAVVPARVDPGSQDTRELAARVGEIAIVW